MKSSSSKKINLISELSLQDNEYTSNQSMQVSNIRQGDSTRRKLFEQQDGLNKIARDLVLENQEVDEDISNFSFINKAENN